MVTSFIQRICLRMATPLRVTISTYSFQGDDFRIEFASASCLKAQFNEASLRRPKVVKFGFYCFIVTWHVIPPPDMY